MSDPKTGLSARRTAAVIGLCLAVLVANNVLQRQHPPRSSALSVGSTSNSSSSRLANALVSFDVILQPASWPRLKSFIARVSDPASSVYGHFVTPEQFAKEFGANTATVSRVTGYMRGFGLVVDQLWSGGVVLPVHGQESAVSKALNVPFSYVKVHGVEVPEASGSWTLPASISGDVVSVLGIYPDGNVPNVRRGNDMVRVRPSKRRVPPPSPPTKVGAGTTNPFTRSPNICPAGLSHAQSLGAYLPSTIASLYGMNTFYSSKNFAAGVTVALPEFAATTPGPSGSSFQSHLNLYSRCIGSTAKISYTSIGSGSHDRSSASLEEAELDAETVLSLAPAVNLKIYSAPQASGDQLYLRIVSDNSASIIVGSWGLCEAESAPSDIAVENLAFAEAAAQGQTVLFASGDGGSEDCSGGALSKKLAVDDPASQPYVTGVGGLMLSSSSPGGEKVWFDRSYGGASGGGTSIIHKQPFWQSGQGVDTQQAVSNCTLITLCREVPDVSALAEGFLVYAPKYGWDVLGGTSGAAPVVASGFALVEAKLHHRMGLVTPMLYRVASSTVGTITDVTSGENDYLGANGGIFSATKGYDPASGLGYIHFNKIIGAINQVRFNLSRNT